MLVYKDERRISEEKNNIQQAENHINKFYKEAEKFLGGLTTDEAKRLPSDAKGVIMDNLRKRYEFPNASDKFNLDALGIDTTEILSLHRQVSKHWTKYKFKYTDNGYIIDNQEKYLKQYYSYADTEEKKSLVSKYKELEKLYNELAEQGASLNRATFYNTFPNVFKDVRDSKYVRLDGEKLAMHLRHLNNLTPLRPPNESAKEAFERLSIK